MHHYTYHLMHTLALPPSPPIRFAPLSPQSLPPPPPPQTGMWSRTLFIWTSDNGAAIEQVKHFSCRVYACCKTHVGVAGLRVEGATQCTLAALQRRYVALGAIEVLSVCIVDEISLCTTVDVHTLLELRKLGCALWLLGGPFIAPASHRRCLALGRSHGGYERYSHVAKRSGLQALRLNRA